jgi:hypothetical protein
VVFNGIFYPEAIARSVAQRRGIRVTTHEVGLRPYSAFFSHDHATFRQVEVTGATDLSPAQSDQLDDYLSARFRGEFSMAGVRFWQGIEDLPPHLIDTISSFNRVVSIFGNVIFDTSQLHANTIFDDMFTWLEELIPIIESHPDILFILRAHPDENRAGKASRETIFQWVSAKELPGKANVEFIGADESLDSYELIKASDLVLVYNSSIGLEASILGKPVLAAGRARFSGQDAVIDVNNAEGYHRQLESLINAPMDQAAWRIRQINARKFLYHELYEASLDLSDFLEEDPYLEGMVQLSDFDLEELEIHQALTVIQQGILHGTPFTYGS